MVVCCLLYYYYYYYTIDHCSKRHVGGGPRWVQRDVHEYDEYVIGLSLWADGREDVPWPPPHGAPARDARQGALRQQDQGRQVTDSSV